MMMIQNRALGKTLVGLLMLWSLGVSMAIAAPQNESTWIALERGKPAEALKLGLNQSDFLNQWIVTVVQMRNGSPVTLESELSAAAQAFESGEFALAEEILHALSQNELNAEDRLHLELRRGACLVELGRIVDAEEVLTRALEQAREQKRPASECFALLTRGRGRVRTREVEPPRQDLEASLALSRRLNTHRWAGVAAIALSVVSRLQMDLDDALIWREAALQHFQHAGDLQGQARALHYIAAIGIMRGDLTRAMTQLQDADGLARQADDEAELGGVLGEMAAINYLLGDFDKALTQYREAVRLAPNPWRRGMMLVNIGSIHEHRRQLDEAVPVLEEALELMRQVGDHRTETQALNSLGEALCELGQYESGLAALDQAIATAREFDIVMSEAYALEIKGQVFLRQEMLAEAAEAFDQATTLARQIDYFDILEHSLLGRAKVARRTGQKTQALQLLSEAINEVDDVRRRSDGASQVTGGIINQAGGIFSETIDLLYSMHLDDPGSGYDEQAFSVAQEARSRAFQDLMTEAQYDLQISADQGYRQREGEILNRLIELETALPSASGDSLGTLQANLAAAEDQLRLLEARLRAEDARYAAVLYPEPLKVKDLRQQVLQPGEVMLEYFLGQERSFLWIIHSAELEMVALPGRQVIEEAVQQLLPLLRDYNLTGAEAAWYTPAARQVFQLLVHPAAGHLKDADHLVICADGILHYLPFGALLTEDSSSSDFRQLPWLIKDLAISYTPSSTVLARLRQESAPQRDGWLLVGDPKLVQGEDAGLFARAAGAAQLPALPYAGQELLALAELAGSKHPVTLLKGADATRGRVSRAGQESDLQLVHFASHGLFNELRPRYSGLVVSPDPDSGDDGFLSVSEVLALDLRCDQVVLSACASALGPHVTGEGLVGLTRSFLFAGSRSVVSALWDVSGQETSLFMQEYYALLAEDASHRAQSLAAAKVQMMEKPRGEGPDRTHPCFWAAFVLSGETR